MFLPYLHKIRHDIFIRQVSSLLGLVSSFIKMEDCTNSLHGLFSLTFSAAVHALNPLPFILPLLIMFGLLESHVCIADLVSDLKLRALRAWFVDSVISCLRKSSTQMSTFPEQIREWLFVLQMNLAK